MQTRRKRLIDRYIKCPECGKVMLLWSKSGRKSGHIKTMHCYYCGKLINGIELDRYGIDK